MYKLNSLIKFQWTKNLSAQVKWIAWHTQVQSRFLYSAFILAHYDKSAYDKLKQFFYKSVKAITNIKHNLPHEKVFQWTLGKDFEDYAKSMATKTLIQVEYN